MGIFSKRIVVVTHNGKFHADDVFAVATLSLLHRGCVKVIRSRNPDDWAKGDFVVDVGGEYNPEKGRFDHHQTNSPSPRENGSPYAAFGLVWKSFGEALCGSKEIATKIDEKIVQEVDILDNGALPIPKFENDIYPYLLQDFLISFGPTWKENTPKDKAFAEAVKFAEKVLSREILRARDGFDAVGEVKRTYDESQDKRIVVLENHMPWRETITKFPEPVFVIGPDDENPTWAAVSVPKEEGTFEVRKMFPESWAGLVDSELQKISGVPDALFCHKKRFMVVAKSEEGAIALAKKALEN
jgi:uncharacterized UPF0160 family protein